MKSRAGLLALLLTLLVPGIFAGAWWMLKVMPARATAQEAYRRVSRVCSMGTPIPTQEGLGRYFEVLLSTPYGRTFLRKLEEEHPSVAFDEPRGAVYFLHQDQKASDGKSDSSFSRCSFKGNSSRRETSEFGARFNSPIRLQKVRVQGDEVRVDFEIPKDAKEPFSFEGKPFAPSSYVTLLDARRCFTQPVFEYEDFFGNARKR